MIRRDFIKISSLAAGSLIAPSSFGSNLEKINIAVLGTGWWGTDELLNAILASGLFNVVGLCDVDSIALNNAADIVMKAGHKEPQLFSSYQEMYELPNLQAVAIATPTHWHPLHFIAACKKGLHVFQEKPISYDIREGQAMLEAHRKAKNVVQVDFPRVMGKTNNEVKAYLESGELGKIYQVQANINSGGGALIEKPVPSTFDFETFCGPAPKSKFMCYPDGIKPVWRSQHDFSRGILVDWGIHYIHNIRKILGLQLPDRVSAIGGITRNFTSDNPDHMEVQYDFQGLPVNWTHKEWGFTSTTPNNDIGVYYFGEKGTLFAGELGWEVYPAGGGEKIVHGDVRFNPGSESNIKIYNKMMIDLFTEFAEGIRTKSNKGITNTLEEAQKTTSCVIYADMAYLSKSELAINPATLNITNNDQAQKMLIRNYRAPYQHPYSV